MYDGIAFIIHDKDAYEKNKTKLIQAIQEKNLASNYICDASVIEYKNNLFLIIDGHDSLLSWKDPETELAEFEESFEKLTETEPQKLGAASGFLHKFLLLTLPTYEKNMKFYHSSYKAIEMMENHQTLQALLKTNSDAFFEDELSIMTAKLEEMQPDFEIMKKKVTRDDICAGYLYSDTMSYILPIMFDITNDEATIEQLASDIFKATTEKCNVNDVKFIETLYQLEI